VSSSNAHLEYDLADFDSEQSYTFDLRTNGSSLEMTYLTHPEVVAAPSLENGNGLRILFRAARLPRERHKGPPNSRERRVRCGDRSGFRTRDSSE